MPIKMYFFSLCHSCCVCDCATLNDTIYLYLPCVAHKYVPSWSCMFIFCIQTRTLNAQIAIFHEIFMVWHRWNTADSKSKDDIFQHSQMCHLLSILVDNNHAIIQAWIMLCQCARTWAEQSIIQSLSINYQTCGELHPRELNSGKNRPFIWNLIPSLHFEKPLFFWKSDFSAFFPIFFLFFVQ